MAGLVVKSAVKAKAPKGMRVSGDLYDALDKAVVGLLATAGKRAKANGRSTIRAADL